MSMIEQDRGYAWVLLMASFVGLMIESGLRPCLGIFTLHFMQDLNTDIGHAVTVFAMANSVTFLAGPVISITVSYIGLRYALAVGALTGAAGYGLSSLATDIHHVIACSVLIGFGSSFIRMTIVAAQPYYFTRYRNLAMNFVMVGPGVGTFVLPPVLILLIDEYTWRGAMLLSSGLMLQCLVVAALIFQIEEPRVEERPKLSIGLLKQLLLCETGVWSDPVFTLQGVGLGLAAGCGYIYFSMIIPLMVQHGVDQNAAAYSFAVQGVFQLVGRMCGTGMLQLVKTQVPLLYTISLAVGMSTELVHLFCYRFWSHTVVNALVGLSNGMFFVTMAPFMVEAFGVKHLTLVFGFSGMYNGVGGFIIPKIAGELARHFGLYSAFYVAAASGALAVTASAIAAGIVQRRNCIAEHKNNEESVPAKLPMEPAQPSNVALIVPERSGTVHSNALSIAVSEHDHKHGDHQRERGYLLPQPMAPPRRKHKQGTRFPEQGYQDRERNYLLTQPIAPPRRRKQGNRDQEQEDRTQEKARLDRQQSYNKLRNHDQGNHSRRSSNSSYQRGYFLTRTLSRPRKHKEDDSDHELSQHDREQSFSNSERSYLPSPQPFASPHHQEHDRHDQREAQVHYHEQQGYQDRERNYLLTQPLVMPASHEQGSYGYNEPDYHDDEWSDQEHDDERRYHHHERVNILTQPLAHSGRYEPSYYNNYHRGYLLPQTFALSRHNEQDDYDDEDDRYDDRGPDYLRTQPFAMANHEPDDHDQQQDDDEHEQSYYHDRERDYLFSQPLSLVPSPDQDDYDIEQSYRDRERDSLFTQPFAALPEQSYREPEPVHLNRERDYLLTLPLAPPCANGQVYVTHQQYDHDHRHHDYEQNYHEGKLDYHENECTYYDQEKNYPGHNDNHEEDYHHQQRDYDGHAPVCPDQKNEHLDDKQGKQEHNIDYIDDQEPVIHDGQKNEYHEHEHEQVSINVEHVVDEQEQGCGDPDHQLHTRSIVPQQRKPTLLDYFEELSLPVPKRNSHVERTSNRLRNAESGDAQTLHRLRAFSIL